jgi:CDP-diacylglycerol--glycerol-3-phosphate 3-phosphatidyltransferase
MKLPMSEKSRIPNAVTCARFILLIPFVWLVRDGSQTHYAAALVVLVVATLTDVFDGYLARKLNSVSDFGSLLDVTADRMLAVTSVTILMGIGAANFYLGLAVICREIAAESIRSLGVRSNSLLPHNLFGRVKFIAIVSAMASGLLALAGTISSASGRQITNALLAIALLSGVSSVLVMQRSVRGGGNGDQQ